MGGDKDSAPHGAGRSAVAVEDVRVMNRLVSL